MTSMDDILEKHAHLKRCKPVSEGGCGEMKLRREYPFNYYINDQGERHRHYYALCRPCLTKRKAKNEGCDKKAKLKHCGPVPGSIERLFFCKIIPVPMSQAMRAARRG